MGSFLESIYPIIDTAKEVRINEDALLEFCKGFVGLESSFKPLFKKKILDLNDTIQLDFIYNAVNFCYWPEPRWTVQYQDKPIHGAYAMKAAVDRALEEGFPLLDSSYIETISKKDFTQITRGNGTLPLFEERLAFLHEVGYVLNKNYAGKAINVVEKANGDAVQLVTEIAANIQGYDDSVNYGGVRVLFHKRAQLVADNVDKALRKNRKSLSSTNSLTALADYKVPQILRDKGILEYSPNLAAHIESRTPILARSQRELEIRAFTLEACERITRVLQKKIPDLKTIDLDHYLYHESKKPNPASKPYHRTWTTAY